MTLRIVWSYNQRQATMTTSDDIFPGDINTELTTAKLASYLDSRSHRKKIGHQTGEAGSQARLRDKAELQLGKANDVIAVLKQS